MDSEKGEPINDQYSLEDKESLAKKTTTDQQTISKLTATNENLIKQIVEVNEKMVAALKTIPCGKGIMRQKEKYC